MVFYISGPKLLFETTEFDSTGVKLYIFIHNEVRDFDKNSTQPEIRVNRIRDNESQLYVDKKSPVMRPNLQPKIYKSPVVA